ncbi:MAG: hypothetical protein Tsb0034_13130 [Ekhidna sp.]
MINEVKHFASYIIGFMSLCIAEAQSFQAVIQKGHGEVIKSARFTEDGDYLVTGSRDKSAKVWKVSSGLEMRSLLGHEHTINDISLHEDLVATSSADGTAAVWQLGSGEMIWQGENYERFVTTVSFSPDGKWLAVGGYADSLEIFSTRDYSMVTKIKVNADRGVGYGIHVSFSPDGKVMSVGEDNRTAKLYKTGTWEFIKELKSENGYCGGCGTLTTFSPDGQSLLKLSNGTSFVKYDVASGEKLLEFRSNLRDVAASDYHKSGRHYLAATEDSVFVFNKNNELQSAFKMDGEINDATFHPSEDWIAIALDKVVVITDLAGDTLQTFSGVLNSSVTGLDYDLGNYWQHYIAKWIKYKSARMLSDAHFFVGKTGTRARKWGIKDATIAMEYIGHESGVVCFEPISEKHIATGGGDGKINIWNESNGKLVKSINAHREPVFDLALNHSGTVLASCSWDGVISFWDTETWDRISYVYNEGASAYTIAYTDNDAYLVAGLLDKSLKLLEPSTGRFVKEFVGHTDNVTSIEVKGDEILTTAWDGKIIIWDLYSGLIRYKVNTGHPQFAASRNESHVFSAGADRTISVWDSKLSKKQTLEGHQAEINGLSINETMMMTTDVDGVSKFWDLQTYDELFEHIQIGKNDWMVKTPSGYFDATDDAISNIHFVRGMEVFQADQFMDQFYKPDLVKRLFLNEKATPKSMGKALEQSPPPSVKMSGIAEGEQAKLFLKAEDNGGGIKEVRLFHNGKRVSLEPQIQKVRADKNAKIYTIEYPMVAGTNEFVATALSDANLESEKASVRIFSDSRTPGSTCHILAVGINEYQNQALNLNYARTDADSFANQLEMQGQKIYTNVVLHQVYDQEATKENILKKIESLKDQVAANDVFIFYYAGHGSMVDDVFYLVSSNASRLYDNARIGEFGIAADELQSAMQEIRALKQLIVMDACQSGGSVEVLAQRGAPEEKAIAQLSRSSGIHVMAAAGSEQYATEFESLGHGLFTYALLNGLSGEADGAPKDGKVTIYELKSYLDDRVPELSIQYKGTPQYPHTFSRGQDFPIVIVE